MWFRLNQRVYQYLDRIKVHLTSESESGIGILERDCGMCDMSPTPLSGYDIPFYLLSLLLPSEHQHENRRTSREIPRVL